MYDSACIDMHPGPGIDVVELTHPLKDDDLLKLHIHDVCRSGFNSAHITVFIL